MTGLSRYAPTRIAAVAALLALAAALLAVAIPHADAASPLVARSRAFSVLRGTMFTPLGNLMITASGSEMMPTTGIRIEAPAGWSFDTASGGVSYSVVGTGLRINGSAEGTVTATTNEVMLPVTAASKAGDVLVVSGIKVKPANPNTLAGYVSISLNGTNVANGPNDVANAASLVASPFDRAISNIGINPAVWMGGSLDQLAAAMQLAGGVSVTAFVDGAPIVFIPGAPDYVNSAFRKAFPYSSRLAQSSIDGRKLAERSWRPDTRISNSCK